MIAESPDFRHGECVNYRCEGIELRNDDDRDMEKLLIDMVKKM